MMMIIILITIITRKHRQLYQHADPSRQWLQVAQVYRMSLATVQ